MGDLVRNVVVSIEVDATGAIWLKRTQQILDGETVISYGQPHRQQIAQGATDGVDAFAPVTDNGAATAPLADLAGDRWPMLQAMLTASQDS